MKPVCLVIGAGAGIGGTVGKRFAREGFHAVLCRRSDEAGLARLVGDIESAGGTASGYLMNAVQEGTIEERVAATEADIGPIEVAVFNLGAQIGNRSLENTSLKAFEMGWRLATFGLFRLAQAVVPGMVERGSGTIIVTSATAAVRALTPANLTATATSQKVTLIWDKPSDYASLTRYQVRQKEGTAEWGPWVGIGKGTAAGTKAQNARNFATTTASSTAGRSMCSWR